MPIQLADATPWQLFLRIVGENALRYLLFAGVAWLLGHVLFARRWRHRKIVPRLPARADQWREFRWSMLTLLVFGVVGTLTLLAARHGWTRVYWRIDDRGWGWFAASIAIAILLHDTWFYWTHRAMHHPRLFVPFHRLHHRSTNPSPWAAYAFSPLEALVQAAIFPLVVALVPIHLLAFFVFMLWQLAFNVLGHQGYEFHPRRLMDTPLRCLLNTPTNHAMHHESPRGNYGLYFNVWDRLMGTNHPDYEARFRAVTAPAPPVAAAETVRCFREPPVDEDRRPESPAAPPDPRAPRDPVDASARPSGCMP